MYSVQKCVMNAVCPEEFAGCGVPQKGLHVYTVLSLSKEHAVVCHEICVVPFYPCRFFYYFYYSEVDIDWSVVLLVWMCGCGGDL